MAGAKYREAYMKSLIVAIALFTLSAPAFSQRSNPEAAVLETVRAFYAAFNSHGFDHSTEFTTDDWNHINPYGSRTRGRMKVLKEQIGRATGRERVGQEV